MELKKLFTPPIFKTDEEKNIEIITLNAAIWTVIALLIFALIGDFLDTGTLNVFFILNFNFLLISFGARYLIKRGWIKQTSILMLILGTVHITLTIIMFGSIRSISTAAFILIITVAGFQFGSKGIISITALISLIILSLITAENNQIFSAPNYNVGISQWITYTALFGLIGNFVFVSVKIIHQFLERSSKEIEYRKKTEEQLHIFSLAIAQSPVSIIITDPQGNIEQVNPKFLELTGYSKEDAIGKNPRILKSGTHSPRFYKKLWKTISSGKEWRGELLNRKKNGELYWEKTSIAPITDKDGVITHYIGTKEDITTQRETQLKLKETNQQLEEQLIEINALQEKLKRQALHDSLTGLHNRHYMDEMLEKEFTRAKRAKQPISIILLDLDHLKKINDTGGHAAGDHALRSLAEQIRTSIRKEDTVCRYGGDEFAIILPNTNAEDALARAHKLNKRIKALTLLHRGGHVLRISFTAGIATYPTHGKTSEEIFNYADVALYRAKLKGRNRVELFSVE